MWHKDGHAKGATRLDTDVCGTSMQVRIAMRTKVQITFCCYNEARHFVADEECNSAESEIDRLPRVELFLLAKTYHLKLLLRGSRVSLVSNLKAGKQHHYIGTSVGPWFYW